MIAFLKGILDEKTLDPPTAYLDVGGVGYEVFVSLSTFDALPPEGDPCRLLTVDIVREDDHLLYGFATAEEKALFLLLTSVSGIGPKLAAAALSGMPVKLLKKALVDGDVKSLSKISGLGKRTAERLIVELKGKINPLEAAAADAASEDEAPLSDAYRDAVLGLVSLGQPQDVAIKAVREIAREAGGKNLASGEIVKRALSKTAR